MTPPTAAAQIAARRKPGDPAQQREAWFEQASEAAYRAVLAITQNQETVARRAIDELRFLKSLINTGEPHQAGPQELVNVAPVSLQRMRLAFEAIRDSDAVIRAWVQQNLAEQSLPLPDVLAWQRRIDHALPELWNFESDLLLLRGSPPAELLDALRQRGQRRLLVLLPEPAGETVALKPTSEQCMSHDGAALAAFVSTLNRPYPKTLACLQVQAAPEASDSESAQAEVEQRIHKAVMNNWMDHNTRRHFAQCWVQQGVANIPAIAHHANLHALDACFRDRPAILIAPGPSLDKNIEQLRQAQDKAVLIAPLQSLRRLYKAGIRPDFVTVLDATDLTTDPFDFFNDVPDDFLTTLVVAVNCHPNVIRRFERVYFFSGGGPLDRWVQDIVPEPLVNLEAASVALSGLLLAQQWACNPIVLVGHDLALAGSRRYAEDAQLNNLNAPQLLTLPGYFGGTVQSPSDYFLFHHQFEQIAAHIATVSPQTRLYNCTEGGAFVKGFEHEPLQRVLDDHVAGLSLSPAADRVAGAQAPNPGRLDVARTRLQRTLETLDELQRQVRQLQRLSQQPRPKAALLRRLSEQEQVLRTQLKRVQGFSTVYQDAIDQAVQSATKAKTLQDNLVASRELYQVISDGCENFRPLVCEALAALGSPVPLAADEPVASQDVSAVA